MADENTVYATSGFRGNALLAIRLGRTGNLTDTDAIAWSFHKNTPYVPSPLLYGHRLYLYSSNNAILSCFDVRSGQTLFGPQAARRLAQRLRFARGGGRWCTWRVATAGGAVIKDADELEVLATNRLDDAFDASPLAGNQLFLRGKDHLYCIAEQ